MYDRALKAGVQLRRATEADYAFMRVLYGTTRAEEMKLFPFTPEQCEAFLDHQFASQSAHYAEHYPTGRFDIIERDGVPIGRLYLDVWQSEVRIVDIAVLPEYQKGGIGSALLLDVFDEARGLGRRVTIHVEAFNPALHLYQRLGFRTIDSNGAYLLMEWTPDQVNTAS
jgi:ribosomal protein S18 acetylase RimI-like enzyme